MERLLSLWIGWRFYMARQSNSFISFISFASTAGITLGVSVLILVLSAMNGFEEQLETRLLGVVPQAELVGVDAAINDWRQMTRDALAIPGIVGAAPFVQMQGLVQKQGGFHGLKVYGIDSSLENNVSTLNEFVASQDWQKLDSTSPHYQANGILLGKSLAHKLGLKVGDTLALYSPSTQKQNASGAKRLGKAKSHRFVVIGLFELGGEIEQSIAYVPLAYAAKLQGLGDGVTGVRIKVDDVFSAPRLIRELGYSQQQYLYMSDWTRSQGHLYNDIQLVRSIMYLVLALVIAVACFNIVSTLVMAVRDKESEIAILMTMGLKRAQVMTIFVFQGALNGLLGSILGAVIGVILAINLSSVASAIESLLGIQFLSGDIYFIDFLPSKLIVSDVFIVTGLALLMSLLATLYPAWRASKTAPARALAGGG